MKNLAEMADLNLIRRQLALNQAITQEPELYRALWDGKLVARGGPMGQRQIGMDADLDTGAKRVCPEGEAQDAPSQPARRVRIGLGRSESQNAASVLDARSAPHRGENRLMAVRINRTTDTRIFGLQRSWRADSKRSARRADVVFYVTELI
jgi:hypothetical protein